VSSNRISLRDWFAVIALSSMIGTLGLLSYLSSESTAFEMENAHYLKPVESINVTVKGAVRYPGVYSLSKGNSIAKLLELAKSLPEADLEQLRLDAKLKKTQTMTIPFIRMITIHLTGAVKEEGALQLKYGTRVQDLISLGVCLESANLKVLHKKRKLKDLEVIHIPHKKQALNKP
jgi:hypothetical protein